MDKWDALIPVAYRAVPDRPRSPSISRLIYTTRRPGAPLSSPQRKRHDKASISDPTFARAPGCRHFCTSRHLGSSSHLAPTSICSHQGRAIVAACPAVPATRVVAVGLFRSRPAVVIAPCLLEPGRTPRKQSGGTAWPLVSPASLVDHPGDLSS